MVGSIHGRKNERFLIPYTGRLLVSEYEQEFVQLNKYAIEILPTKQERHKRFEQGLHANIKVYLTTMYIRKFLILVEATYSLKRIKQEEQRKKGKKERAT